MIFKYKKSQLLILSTLVLCSLLLFIYSLETQKNYITYFDKKNSVMFFEKEMCHLVEISNGSNIEERLRNYSLAYESFCKNIFSNCDTEVYIVGSLPNNVSLINSSYFLLELEISSTQFFFRGNFSC